MKKLSYKTLYILWAVLFVLTAAVGLAFPGERSLPGKAACTVLMGLFFLLPWSILGRAKAEGSRFHVRLVRWLCLGSLTLTALLLVLNLRSAGFGENLGRILNTTLTVVSAPMLCANTFAAPLFLWGCLLADTVVKK